MIAIKTQKNTTRQHKYPWLTVVILAGLFLALAAVPVTIATLNAVGVMIPEIKNRPPVAATLVVSTLLIGMLLIAMIVAGITARKNQNQIRRDEKSNASQRKRHQNNQRHDG